ncbi:hypothetical protein SDC9_164591 [bioreactor metagenome]|uniref:Uncharacterized protein n=1 Tax=bioreactor metagenome TaxID=1076179 RepID=A0A645FTJ4_9ZZZZ
MFRVCFFENGTDQHTEHQAAGKPRDILEDRVDGNQPAAHDMAERTDQSGPAKRKAERIDHVIVGHAAADRLSRFRRDVADFDLTRDLRGFPDIEGLALSGADIDHNDAEDDTAHKAGRRHGIGNIQTAFPAQFFKQGAG